MLVHERLKFIQCQLTCPHLGKQHPKLLAMTAYCSCMMRPAGRNATTGGLSRREGRLANPPQPMLNFDTSLTCEADLIAKS